jgi:MOSC domain-containing protein YiiM
LKVVSVNVSTKKGTPKESVNEIIVKPEYGIVGDAHAGPGIRQISLLAKESHDKFQPMTDVCLKNGIFGENITTEGMILPILKLGTRFNIGTATLEVSKIGKECHAPCSIGKTVGKCIMPKECIFVIVIKEGIIKPGDKIYEVEDDS